MFARKYVVDASAAATTVIAFPYIDTDHLKLYKNGILTAMPADTTFSYDKDTGETTITWGTAQTARLLEVRRETPVATTFSGIKRKEDTLHGSSLVMGINYANLEQLFILQEMLDAKEVGSKFEYNVDCALTDGTYQFNPLNGNYLVKSVRSVLRAGAITTNDAVVTTRINTTAMTGGVITIANSGSAAGDKDSGTAITGANLLVDTDYLAAVVSGTPGGSRVAGLSFLLEPVGSLS